MEANPVCTGCYVSRIELKLYNRRLEGMLFAAEAFSAFATQYCKFTYPRGKFERLWGKMALLQFHDAITGSHSDGAYDELMSLSREIARAAWKAYEDATRIITGNIAINVDVGYKTLAVFNPLQWAQEGMPIDLVVDVPSDEDGSGIEFRNGDGTPLSVLAIENISTCLGGKLTGKVLGLHLPPHGYATVSYRFVKNTLCKTNSIDGKIIENEFYRISFDKTGIKDIFDKESEQSIMGAGACGLLFEEDYGSPWETLAQPSFSCLVSAYSEPKILLSGDSNFQQALITGEFNDKRIQHERGITKIQWSQEITIYRSIKRIYIKTRIDWDSCNSRLMQMFPLAFKPHDDSAFYEIPFGVLARKSYKGEFGIHTKPNGDWPTLDFVSIPDESKHFYVNIFNKGTPCCRMDDGVVKATLLRSPCIPVCSWDFAGARDVGIHSFDMMITSGTGELVQVNPIRDAREFNAQFITMPCERLSKNNKNFPSSFSFLAHSNPGLAISAVKLAEDGGNDMIVRMYEPYGRKTETCFDGISSSQIEEVDLLEKRKTDISFKFLPHEIKTFKIGRIV